MSKLKQGQLCFMSASNDSPVYKDGAVLMVVAYNPHEGEYQVTDIIDSKPTAGNPIHLKNEEGFYITKEQFDSTEYIPYDRVKPLPLLVKPYHTEDFAGVKIEEFHPVEDLSPLDSFFSGYVFKVALGVLLFCSGALVALEFLK